MFVSTYMELQYSLVILPAQSLGFRLSFEKKSRQQGVSLTGCLRSGRPGIADLIVGSTIHTIGSGLSAGSR